MPNIHFMNGSKKQVSQKSDNQYPGFISGYLQSGYQELGAAEGSSTQHKLLF